MKRTCPGCDGEFEGKRSTAVYCSPTCRKRGQRRAVEGPIEAAPATGGLVAATRTELEAAGRIGSMLGQQALALAARIEASERETGASVASLSKELRAVMVEAMKGAVVAADPLDELRARRDRKRSAG